jgi:hypothetical protein
MPSKQPTARDELARLREVLALRERAVDELRAERERALAAVEAAKQDQRRLYASAPPGGTPAAADEQRMTEAVVAAELAANSPWQVRDEGARLAIEDARRALTTFVRERFDDLFAELLPPSVAAQARLADALDEAEQALGEWGDLAWQWSRIAPMAGIAADDLATLDLGAIQSALPDDVPVPGPASLLYVADDGEPIAVGANDDEGGNDE